MKPFISRLLLFLLLFSVFQIFFLPEAKAVDIQLYEGWNLIGLSVNPAAPYTASILISDINSQGGSVQEIDRWYNSGWDSHIAGLPFNNFDIELDEGYFVRCSTSSTWVITGTPLNITAIPLSTGWNLISLPAAGYFAQSLLDDINAQGGAAQEADRWYNAGWDSHINGLPFNNFSIDADKGYFVRCNSAIIFSLEEEEIQPPTGLSAAAGNQIVNLTWQASLHPLLAGYNVYRSQVQGGPYTKINTSLVVTNSYQDTSLTNGITYYYVVTAQDSSNNESTYSTEVSVVPQLITPESEPNNDFLSADSLSQGIPLTAVINPEGDLDYFKVHADSGGTFSVAITNVSAGITPYMEMYSSDYSNLGYWPGSLGQPLSFNLDISQAGDYYIVVADMNMASSDYPYTLTVNFTACTDPYEPNNTFAAASTISLDTVISTPNFFPTSDLDWYKVNFASTGVFTFTVTNVPSGIDVNIQLYDSSQMWVESTTQGGGQGQPVTLTAEISQAGYYYVLVQDMMGGTSTSQYTLKAEIGVSNDLYESNNTFDTAAALNLETVITPDLFPSGDIDWFKVTVNSPGMLIVYLYDVPASISANIEIYNDQEEWQEYITQGGGQGQALTLRAEITEAGDYYLKIYDLMGGYSASPYSLKAVVTELWFETFSHSPDPFSPNADGIKDTIAISVALSKSASWTITINDSSEVTVRTFFGSGTTINRVWDGKDELNAVVADGRYTCLITAHDPLGGFDAEPLSATIDVDTTAPTAIISAPANGETVGGTVTISGTVDDVHLGWESYVYYGQGASPSSWQWIYNLWQPMINTDLAEWDTTYLSNGDYVLRLNITDNAGNSTITDVPIILYNLIINNPMVSYTVFSPNNDGVKDTTNISAQLTGSADWTITIKDSSDSEVRVFSGSGSAINQSWDGKDSDIVVVVDGTYTYYIDAHDPIGGAVAPMVSGIIDVDNTPPVAVITSPLPGTEVNGTVDITGTVNDVHLGWESYLYYGEGLSPANWEWITNIGGMIEESSLAAWDTISLANGNYVLRLDITDFVGNRTITDVPITIYNLVITNPAANPPAFSPNGDGVSDHSLITARVSCSAEWGIDIKNQSGILVKTFSGLGSNISQSWDGTDSSDNLVSEGTYTYYINAHDPLSGEDALAVTGTIKLDITPPSATLTHPVANEIVGGVYDITGTADDLNFAAFTCIGNSHLAYAQGISPAQEDWSAMASIDSAVPEESVLSTWDTTYVPSGLYSLRLMVFDQAENITTVSVPINICEVGDFYTTVNPFSPNNDGIKDSSSIIAMFSQVLDWTIEIKNPSNITVRSFTGSSKMISQVWDGKDSSNAIAADGTYTYYIIGRNPSTAAIVFNDSDTIDVDNTPPTVEITNPLPNDTISESISIEGISNDLHYDGNNSFISYGEGSSPAVWTTIGDISFPVTVPAALVYWDSTELVNGVYTIRLIAADTAGNVSETRVTVNTYNVRIISYADTPDPFSPDSDGEKDTTTISALFTMALDWEIFIKDTLNNTIKTFAGTDNSISCVWDGTDEASQVVADGNYSYIITVTDGTIVYEAYGAINVDKDCPLAQITSPADSAVIFGLVSISGSASDGNFAKYTLEYGVGTAPSEWICISEYYVPVTNDILGDWDTLSVNNGTYTLRLKVEDSVSHTSFASVIVTVDNIMITDVSINPTVFIPLQGQTTTISYTLDRDAGITLKIYDLQNNLVKTLIDSASRSSGVNSQVWDGTNDLGQLVSDNGYMFTISADGGRGWYQTPLGYGSVNWDSVTNFSVSQNFNPYKNELCRVNFTLLEDSLFTLGFGPYMSGGAYFWAFQGKAMGAGEHIFYWDGRDPQGDILPYYTADYPIVVAYYSLKVQPNTIIVESPRTQGTELSSDGYAIIVVYGDRTTIKYTIPVDGNVTLSIYEPPDVLMTTLVNNQHQTAGMYSLVWDGMNSSGKPVAKDADYIIKVVEVTAEGETITRTGNISVGYIRR